VEEGGELYEECEVLTLEPGDDPNQNEYVYKIDEHGVKRYFVPQPKKRIGVFSPTKEQEICKFSQATVRLFARYENKARTKEKWFVGTAFFIGVDASKKTKTKDVYGDSDLYELKEVKITSKASAAKDSVVPIWSNCKVLSKKKDMKNVEHGSGEGAEWKILSDFAVLEAEGFESEFFYVPATFTDTIDRKMIVCGYPAMVEKSNYPKTSEKKLTYEEWYNLFHKTQHLCCSHGEYKANFGKLHGYNPNTTGGMSGGPVCTLEKPDEVVGIHVGGSDDQNLNFFVPIGFAVEEAKRLGVLK